MPCSHHRSRLMASCRRLCVFLALAAAVLAAPGMTMAEAPAGRRLLAPAPAPTGRSSAPSPSTVHTAHAPAVSSARSPIAGSSGPQSSEAPTKSPSTDATTPTGQPDSPAVDSSSATAGVWAKDSRCLVSRWGDHDDDHDALLSSLISFIS